MSMAFTFISLLECIVVLYFYYKKSKDFAPWWWNQLKEWRTKRRARNDHGSTTKHSDTFEDNGRLSSRKGMSLGSLADLIKSSDHTDSVCDEPKLVESEMVDRPTPPLRGLDDCGEEEKKDSEGSSAQNCTRLDSSMSSNNEGGDTVGELPSRPKFDVSEVSERSMDLLDMVGTPSTGKQESIKSEGDMAGNYGEIETNNPLTMSMISNLSYDDRPESVKSLTRRGRQRDSTETNHDASPGVDHGIAAASNKTQADPDDKRVTFSNEGKLNLSRRTSWMNEYQDMVSSVKAMTSYVAPPRDADDFNDEEEIANNRKWKAVAGHVDDLARIVCPMAFAVALAIILGEIGNMSESEV